MFFTVGPERYSAPPVETWMIPSDSASANPLRAALRVWDEDTLMAGNAKDCCFAASSISAYFSGVAIGMAQTLMATDRSPPASPGAATWWTRHAPRALHRGV